MITQAPPQDTAIFSRLLDETPARFSPEFAEYIVGLRFGSPDTQRMQELAQKARDGELDEVEQVEIDSYERVGQLLNVLQAKARMQFAKRSTSPKSHAIQTSLRGEKASVNANFIAQFPEDDMQTIKTQWIWISLVAIASATGGFLQAQDRAPRRYALVVGVQQYRPQQDLPTLPYTERDADRMAAVLTDKGFQVTLMTQTLAREKKQIRFQPMASLIRDEFKALVETPFLGPKDVVVVALAGHGVQFNSRDAKNKQAAFYFCPADADIRKLQHSEDVQDKHNLVSVDELYATLDKAKAGVRLLLVDSCRVDPSQAATSRDPSSITRPQLPTPPGGLAAFFSCSATQRAFEDKDLRHGVFFNYVIEALDGKGDFIQKDGKVTVTELKEYVGSRVYDYVRKKHGAQQMPDFKGEIRGAAEILTLQSNVLTNSIGMKLVLIQPGEFLMGSPASEKDRGGDEYQHRVRITKPFYMGQHEVMVGQVLEWLNSPGISFDEKWVDLKSSSCPVKRSGNQFVLNTSSKFGESTEQPMVEISWLGAVAFCDWLSRKDGRTYRLPTEAEWEYAARADSTTPFPWGDTLNGKEANIDGNYPYGTSTKGPYLQKTAKVGSYRPNAWGLYDTVGNVLEWCADWHDGEYYKNSPASDPKGPGSGQSRVFRGGGWYYFAWYCRSADRYGFSPDYRHFNLGFRVAAVRVIEP